MKKKFYFKTAFSFLITLLVSAPINVHSDGGNGGNGGNGGTGPEGNGKNGKNGKIK